MEIQEIELIELLSTQERNYFESLAPSYKKLFINHAFKSKVPNTRLKNIDEVKAALELKCKTLNEYKKLINPKQTNNFDNLSDEQKINIYFEQIENRVYRESIVNLYEYLIALDPSLSKLYAWNTPMIKSNEAFNCGLSVAKNHFTIAFDIETLEFFKERIIKNNYQLKVKTFSIKYNQDIDFELLREMVLFSIELRRTAKGFWQ